MSIRYRAADGTETIVSGLTPGGDIEAGAVATRTGTATVPANSSSTYSDVTVTFDTPMPDNDYIVDIKPLNGGFEYVVWFVGSKTINGFLLRTYGLNGSKVNYSSTYSWTAIKTYTVQHAAQNAADIAEIKSAIPAGAGPSNKLVTTTQFNNAMNPLAESVADIQDAVPTDASITNKLVSQETLDNTLEEADEGIWEVMGKNGAKNKLPFDNSHMRAINGGGTWNVNAYTYNGITYTLNSNGTITVNGTATAYSIFRIVDSNSYNFKLDSNEIYYLTGSPTTGSSSSTYYVYYSELIGGTWTYYINYGTGDTQFTPNASATQVVVDIIVRDGQSISNQIFKPMIRLASDLNDSYQPYAMTNQQITPVVQSISNPNLLDNPWFTVNQRGLTQYSGSNAYSLDRWRRSSSRSIIDLTSNGITISSSDTASTYSYVHQRVEDDLYNSLHNKTITVSILYSDGHIEFNSGQVDTSVTSTTSFAQTVPYQNTWISFGHNANEAFGNSLFIITDYPSKSTNIRAVKLELGSVSTLANNVAPNYQQELAKCQRYFQRLNNITATDTFCIGAQRNNTTLRTVIPLTVPMRANPTVTINGTVSDYTNSGLTLNKVGAGVSNGGIVGVNFNITKTNVTWRDGVTKPITPDSNDFYIDFSADL